MFSSVDSGKNDVVQKMVQVRVFLSQKPDSVFFLYFLGHGCRVPSGHQVLAFRGGNGDDNSNPYFVTLDFVIDETCGRGATGNLQCLQCYCRIAMVDSCSGVSDSFQQAMRDALPRDIINETFVLYCAPPSFLGYHGATNVNLRIIFMCKSFLHSLFHPISPEMPWMETIAFMRSYEICVVYD